jgi:hypothetical protein
MFGKKFISKETRDWSDEQDDDGFVELTPTAPPDDLEDDLGIPIAFKEPKKEAVTVRDRLEKLSGVNVHTGDENLVSVRERLEDLKHQKRPVPKPLGPKFFPENQPSEEKKTITPESVMQGKIEKAMGNVEALQKKMHDSPSSYLSLFYDLKQAEKGFLDLLSEAEDKQVALSGTVMARIAKVKSKIRSVKL